jgi:PPOX class probable F420-dependent enzyme
MSIRLSEDEAWDVLAHAHTGILTTLRADGSPITLPTWFVALDRTICFASFEGTKKLARLARDPRASFLVESGEQWAELRAVHLSGVVEPIDDDAAATAVSDALDVKYRAFRTARTDMPERTKQAYSRRRLFRLVPDARILSWDNSRLQLRP